MRNHIVIEYTKDILSIIKPLFICNGKCNACKSMECI